MSDHKEFCPELGAGDAIHKTVMIESKESQCLTCDGAGVIAMGAMMYGIGFVYSPCPDCTVV